MNTWGLWQKLILMIALAGFTSARAQQHVNGGVRGAKAVNKSPTEVVDIYLDDIYCEDNIQIALYHRGLEFASLAPMSEEKLREAFSQNLYYTLQAGEELDTEGQKRVEIYNKVHGMVLDLTDIAVFYSSTLHELFAKVNDQRKEAKLAVLTKEDFLNLYRSQEINLPARKDGVDQNTWVFERLSRIAKSASELNYGCAKNGEKKKSINFIHRRGSAKDAEVPDSAFRIPATITNRRPASTTTTKRLREIATDAVDATFYYTPRESDRRFAGPKTRKVLDMRGNTLATVSESFYAALRMQGAGQLNDGRTLNVDNKKGDSWRYFVTPYKYGQGSETQIALKPWRSIAIDTKHYSHLGLKNGQKVFIPTTVGLKIPETGEIHDGYWEIADIGTKIQGRHIDMFTGNMHWLDAQAYVKTPSNYASGRQPAQASSLGSSNRRRAISLKFMR